MSGLYSNSPPFAPGVLHVVQWVAAPLRHLVGHQLSVCDHDVRHGGVPVHENGAKHNSSEHGRGGQVRRVSLTLLRYSDENSRHILTRQFQINKYFRLRPSFEVS